MCDGPGRRGFFRCGVVEYLAELRARSSATLGVRPVSCIPQVKSRDELCDCVRLAMTIAVSNAQGKGSSEVISPVAAAC
jgi:hypothetical protein